MNITVNRNELSKLEVDVNNSVTNSTIKLPDYFEALTRKENRTVLLTAKGEEPYRLSYDPIIDGQFIVYGTKQDGEFYWEVKAVRADVEELEVEQEK